MVPILFRPDVAFEGDIILAFCRYGYYTAEVGTSVEKIFPVQISGVKCAQTELHSDFLGVSENRHGHEARASG